MCTCVCVYMHVCACMCGCVCVHVISKCTCVCLHKENKLRCCFLGDVYLAGGGFCLSDFVFVAVVFETQPLTALDLTELDKAAWSMSLGDLPVSASSGLQMCTTMPGFFLCEFWEMNSGPSN